MGLDATILLIRDQVKRENKERQKEKQKDGGKERKKYSQGLEYSPDGPSWGETSLFLCPRTACEKLFDAR